VTGGDLLQEAVAELYSADPDEFIAQRGELVTQARAAGEAAMAKQIAALRKPTRSAWVVNRLVRAEPDTPAQLATLGAELRAAQQSLNGPALRELSRQRRQLVDTLGRQAFSAAGQKSPPAALRDEVASTLGAALADPQVAERLRAGALERAVRRDGLETAGDTPGDALPAASWRAAVPEAAAAQAAAARATGAQGGARGGARRGSAPAPAAAGPRRAGPGRAEPSRAGPRGVASRRAEPEDAAAPRVVPLASARRRAPAASAARDGARPRPLGNVTALAAARAKTERDRHRQAVAAAEQAVAQAEQAERAAAQVEQEQQSAVQLLEEQLADARQRLAEARIRAHRARTGQRQARRALDRLQKTPRA